MIMQMRNLPCHQLLQKPRSTTPKPAHLSTPQLPRPTAAPSNSKGNPGHTVSPRPAKLKAASRQTAMQLNVRDMLKPCPKPAKPKPAKPPNTSDVFGPTVVFLPHYSSRSHAQHVFKPTGKTSNNVV